MNSATRDSILTDAAAAINGPRQQSYGSATDGFTKVGEVWGTIIGCTALDPEIVALMLAALKLVRLIDNPGHLDSWVDMCGYAALGGEIAGAQ